MKISFENLNTINKHNIDCALLMVHLIMYSASVEPVDVPWFDIFSERLEESTEVN